MEIQDFSHHLEGIEAAVKRQLERDLPKKLGNLAVRMFKENFQKESFFGRAWKYVVLLFLCRPFSSISFMCGILLFLVTRKDG